MNLTSINGHRTVPEESMVNVVEKLLDDNIKNKSETVENMESPHKHTAGVEQLKMTAT